MKILESIALAAILGLVMDPAMALDQRAFLSVVIALSFVGARTRFAELREEGQRLRVKRGPVFVKRNGVWVERF